MNVVCHTRVLSPILGSGLGDEEILLCCIDEEEAVPVPGIGGTGLSDCLTCETNCLGWHRLDIVWVVNDRWGLLLGSYQWGR